MPSLGLCNTLITNPVSCGLKLSLLRLCHASSPVPPVYYLYDVQVASSLNKGQKSAGISPVFQDLKAFSYVQYRKHQTRNDAEDLFRLHIFLFDLPNPRHCGSDIRVISSGPARTFGLHESFKNEVHYLLFCHLPAHSLFSPLPALFSCISKPSLFVVQRVFDARQTSLR